MGGNEGLIIPQGEERNGWFKLMVPAIEEVLGDIVIGQQLKLLPFLYAKLDPEQVAFDIALSQPMFALDKVALVQIDQKRLEQIRAEQGQGRKTEPKKPTPIQVVGLSVISSEQEGRCYLSVGLVSCIIPVRPEHPLVNALVVATSESQIIAPTAQEASKILNMSGEPVEPTPGG